MPHPGAIARTSSVKNQEQRRAELSAKTGIPIELIQQAEEMVAKHAPNADLATLRNIFETRERMKGALVAMEACHDNFTDILANFSKVADQMTSDQAALGLMMSTTLLCRLFKIEQTDILRICTQSLEAIEMFEDTMKMSGATNPFEEAD